MGIIFVINGCGGTTVDLGTLTSPEATTPSQSTSSNTGNYDVPAIDASLKQSYLDAINTARAVSRECGTVSYDAVPALAWSDELYRSAYEHSQDLALSNTFAHEGSNTDSDWTAKTLNLGRGSSMSERVTNNGYNNWTNVGENISAGRTTVQQAIDGWIESAGHCANLMNPSFTEVGLAQFVYTNSSYQTYWTQTFGSR
jgi:uncharacterized protein YkwD